ncbi:MAG: 2-amino-4-hydroxy-6-hydroxymethyldihydropteridine diphosphokinase [Armatimonadetes bacterium]|nr:2-amino-4-hydroxy-6-hydroxymethyldihydropteridine diphosphokinase [Armatimonadota bacterium]
MTPIAIAFGSNLGDRTRHIVAALERLENLMRIDRVSGIYETEPMYVHDQPSFLNGVVIGSTALGPLTLVTKLKEVEKDVGRLKRIKNGPREIDLDLVLFGALVLRSKTQTPVQVPHPRMAERRFVLEPLAEVAPDANVPKSGVVAQLLAKDDVQSQSVRRVADAPLPIPSAR